MPNADELAVLLTETITPDTGYNVVPIPSASGYRVGRGPEGSVVLLTPPESKPEAPTNLKRISMAPRIRCRIESVGAWTEIEAGVVEFRDDEPEMVQYFLGVAGALVDLLGPSPAAGQISAGLQRMLRLFAAQTVARGSELGLWGELLLMTTVKDPPAMVDAWHAHVDDRFDFATEGARLEVKTTTRGDRAHHFNLVQLLPVHGCTQHVASIVTAETDAGTSVAELVADLGARLVSHPGTQMKLLEQVATLLGTDWPKTATREFDAQSARSSLRIVPAHEIPKVAPGPPEVLDVTILVSLSAIPGLSPVEAALSDALVRQIGVG